MNRAMLWPIAIATVLALTMAANIAVLVRAGGGEDAPIEPDYYRKAVAWDSTMAQRDRNAALGWQLDAALAAGTLSVRLTDRDGAPLEGAAIAVEAVHNRAARPLRAQLTARGAEYGVALPLAHPGLWELRFDVLRDGARFTQVVRLDTGPPIAHAAKGTGGGS